MNTRIRELRKHLKMNQTEFGKRVGLTTSGLSDLENRTGIPEAIIKLAVSEFGCSENWLRTGEGAMFDTSSSTRAERLNARLNSNGDTFLKEVIYKLCEIPPDQLETAYQFILEVCDNCRKAEADKAPLEFPQPEDSQSESVENDA